LNALREEIGIGGVRGRPSERSRVNLFLGVNIIEQRTSSLEKPGGKGELFVDVAGKLGRLTNPQRV